MTNRLITAIIPTLGKKNLNNLIFNLINETQISEILLSVPFGCSKKNLNFNNEKVAIVYNNYKHQVKQRIYALRYVKTQLILFLDDDVIYKGSFLKNLINLKFHLGRNSVLGPIYYDTVSKKKIHNNDNSFKQIIKKITYFLFFFTSIFPKRMGTISMAGTCYGVDPDYMSGKFKEVDWLPGGCILINKNQFIKKNYFFSSSKAYCEDLVLSTILKKNNNKLYVCRDAILYTDAPVSVLDKKKDLRAYIGGLRILQKYRKKNFISQLFIFYLRLKLHYLS
jgi:GT2 family glycosyltransferase